MEHLITGAFGRVGTAILDHRTDDYDFNLFDRVSHPDFESHVGDIAEYSVLEKISANAESIIHLAGNPNVGASWPETLTSNIMGTYNCFEVARQQEISKIIFASTNHVVGMYEQEHAPELYDIDYDFIVDATTPVRPDSHYGVSKVYGEALGRYYVENFEFPKQVFNLRIGSVRSPQSDHPYADAEAAISTGETERGGKAYRQLINRMKATWLSRRDMAQLVECCLKNETVEFGIYYGISDNERSWFDLKTATEGLDYQPVDAAEDWDTPPAEGMLEVSDSVYHTSHNP